MWRRVACLIHINILDKTSWRHRQPRLHFFFLYRQSGRDTENRERVWRLPKMWENKINRRIKISKDIVLDVSGFMSMVSNTTYTVCKRNLMFWHDILMTWDDILMFYMTVSVLTWHMSWHDILMFYMTMSTLTWHINVLTRHINVLHDNECSDMTY
jgi:hypothetical protein